jgi:hypothetical protein
VRLLLLLLTTYLAAQAITALLWTRRLEVTLEFAAVAVAVALVEWAALRLFRRAFAQGRG